MISSDDARTLGGSTVTTNDGDKIGKVGQVYFDDQTQTPAWITVQTGLFGTKQTFVPVRDATVTGDGMTVPYGKDQVKKAPTVEVDGHLSVQEEADLYRYYGLDDTSPKDTHESAPNAGRRDHAGDPGVEGRDTSGPTTDDAMTRSEEQLHVGTETVETGRARLRKYVVTEQVTQTVPVSHEEVRIESEPITEANRGDAMAGGDLTSEEHEVTLHAEQPVVEKETVPVERVRLGTETMTGEEQINEEVRKEQIDTDNGESNRKS